MSTIRFREQSHVGWLMLQWLAVLVLGHRYIERRGARFMRLVGRVGELPVTVLASSRFPEELARQGHAVQHTQPPEAPEVGPMGPLYKVPRAPFDGGEGDCLLAVTREFAEAMGLDPDELERA